MVVCLALLYLFMIICFKKNVVLLFHTCSRTPKTCKHTLLFKIVRVTLGVQNIAHQIAPSVYEK